MDSITNIINRIQVLQKEIAGMKEYLKTAPDGSIFSRCSSKGVYKYFKSIKTANGVQEIYLNKKSTSEAAQLARKKLTEMELIDKEKELDCLNAILKYRTSTSRSDYYKTQHPGIVLLSNEAGNNSTDSGTNSTDPFTAWKNQPYDRNFSHPEALIYPTIIPGLKVRSKSEADIVSRFEHFNIPYHYDEYLQLCDEKIAIDFTCKNRRTGGLWCWDHRGMLDDAGYIKKTLYCESLFLKSGIIQGVNLIVTTETRAYPLDILWVDHLIQYYLL